jgi:dTDP-4-dehydrorhamnose 3,5-epimerase
MELRKTKINDLVEFFPRIFHDERGLFFESYNKETFSNLGLNLDFVQDNMSKSKVGVLRGLHFQKIPFEQGKLVSVISGRVLDVAVDIRPESKTFGHYETFILDGERKNMVYIPEGFAHGFLTLEEAILTYKCTNVYNKSAESGIIWNDPELSIDWGNSNPIISQKDAILPGLKAILKI